MKTPITAAEDVLHEKHLQYSQENESTLSLMMSNDVGHWKTVIHSIQEHNQLLVLSIFPMRVPQGFRPHIAEHITRANYGMVLGNFEMDMNDGEIRYKTSIIFDQVDPSKDMIVPLIDINLQVMNKFFSPIMSMVFGNMDNDTIAKQIDSMKLLDEIERWLADDETEDT